MVDFNPIIKPLRGPTCKLKTSKTSTQVEVASWARVWQNLSSANADRDQEILTLQLANKTAKDSLQKLNKSTQENRNKLEKKNTQLDKANKEVIDIKKRLDEKDANVVELKKTNVELEEKLVSLLDVLYGCEECGRHGDYCECKLG